MLNKEAIVSCLQEHGYELDSQSKNPSYKCLSFEKKDGNNEINIDFIEEREGNLYRFGVCFSLPENKVKTIVIKAKEMDFVTNMLEHKNKKQKYYYCTFPIIKSGLNINSLTEGLHHIERFIFEVYKIITQEKNTDD